MPEIDCIIPRAAAEALNLPRILRGAHADHVADARLEYSEIDVGPGRTHVSTSVPMAHYLAEQLRVLMANAEARSDVGLMVACSKGMAALVRAIDEAMRESEAMRASPAPTSRATRRD